jgi:hypothetical protein
MKTLLAIALSLAAFNSFANTTDTLTSVLPVGSYSGSNDRGACTVEVSSANASRKAINVTVSENAATVSKLVVDGSEFRFRANKKEFVQTDTVFTDSDRTSYNENIIRTTIAGDNQLYVVTSQATVDNTDRNETVAECVIDL